MNLTQLKEKGGFVSSVPVKKSVTWKRMVDEATGLPPNEDTKSLVEAVDTFDVYIKRRSFGSVERLINEEEKQDRSKMAEFLASSILIGEGEELTGMTYTDAFQLEIGLAGVLIDAVNEVNGTGKQVKK